MFTESSLLQAAIRAHEEARQRLTGLVEGLSDAQANWKPAPKSWSIAECIEHLNQALETYMEKMTSAIDLAREQGQTGAEPYGRGTLTGRLLVNVLNKPAKKVRAPGVFQPASSRLAIDETAESLHGNLTQLIEAAKRADGLALGAIKIATPVSGLIRLSLAQAFEVHTLHTPRHLAQAERVKAHNQFPS